MGITLSRLEKFARDSRWHRCSRLALRRRPPLTHRPPPSHLHPPSLYHILILILTIPVLWCPCGFLLPPHPSSLCPLPSSLMIVAYLNRTCRMLSHRRTQPPYSPPLSSLVLRGATEPCPPITPGRGGYNAALRAGSCQLVITAKKETHTRVHKHTHTALLAPTLIRGPSPSNRPE